MGLLRKASLKDFPQFKKIYEDEDFKYQWMYYYPMIKNPNLDYSGEKSCRLYNCEDFAEEYLNYTEERFRTDLQITNIFMIENDGKIVGYVQLFFCGNGVYKLAEWAMTFNNYDVKVQVLNEIKALKLPRYKKLEICLIHKPAIKFFLDNGFKEDLDLFLKWEKS